VLREQITKLPPRHETQQAIDQVNQDIASIQASITQQQHLNEVLTHVSTAGLQSWPVRLSRWPAAVLGVMLVSC
jgi:hypothetical protein